jgi:hypothetical protein
MSLFIQNDSGTVGAGTVFPDRAEADLFTATNMDTNFGENAPVGDLIQVTYGTQQTTGPCPTRIHDLINTEFNVNPQHIDIIILAVDGSFTLSDGTSLTNFGGLTMPVGNSENPTNSVLVVYDTSQDNGAGYCLKGKVSGNYDLQTPNAVILYHELSHAFRDATNTSLSTAATGCTASPEEAAAETDENDLRTQLGIPLRDTTDHCGQPCSGGAGPNTGSCCIVASIATGSVYSAEVNALRQVRDSFLRRSEIGFSFFDWLFEDYYAFSPQVCRLMAISAPLRERIDREFVRPLTMILTLIHDSTLCEVEPVELGRRFESGLATMLQLSGMSRVQVVEALRVLQAVRIGAALSDPALTELSELLNAHAFSSPPVRWALMDTVEIYANALLWYLDGEASEEIGRRLSARIDSWAAQMPLTGIWRSLAIYEIRQELIFLKRCLLRNDDARRQFGERLLEHFPDDRRLPGLLVEAEYISQRRPA